jgi:hypothetical protein
VSGVDATDSQALKFFPLAGRARAVYLLPAKKVLRLERGRFRLGEPEGQELHRPIGRRKRPLRGAGRSRAWVAGCATGEEAYTLAMLLDTHLSSHRKPLSFRLFATDVRPDCLNFARRGVYPELRRRFDDAPL